MTKIHTHGFEGTAFSEGSACFHKHGLNIGSEVTDFNNMLITNIY